MVERRTRRGERKREDEILEVVKRSRGGKLMNGRDDSKATSCSGPCGGVKVVVVERWLDERRMTGTRAWPARIRQDR